MRDTMRYHTARPETHMSEMTRANRKKTGELLRLDPIADPRPTYLDWTLSHTRNAVLPVRPQHSDSVPVNRRAVEIGQVVMDCDACGGVSVKYEADVSESLGRRRTKCVTPVSFNERPWVLSCNHR